jgi:hypothetical protein
VRQLTVLSICFATAACSANDGIVTPPARFSGPYFVGPSSLNVQVRVLGQRPDRSGFFLELSPANHGDPLRRTVDSLGGNVIFPNLAPGQYSLRLDLSTSRCFTTAPDGINITIRSSQAAQVRTPILCVGDGTTYERSTPYAAGSDALFERYVIYERDGVFRWQYEGRFGPFESVGTYAGELTGAVQFLYDGFEASTVTRIGERCISVRYSFGMVLSGFEDGVYCRAD